MASRSRFAAALPTLWNVAGFGLVALSGYIFMMLVNRHPDSQYNAAVTSYYVLVTTVVLGVCAGLEQGTNRRLAFTLAAGADPGRAIRRSIRDAAALVAVTAAVLGAAVPVLVPRTLRGEAGLFGALLVGLAVTAVASLLRGLLVGAGRFTAYALTWAVEGISRIALVAVVFASGYPAAWALGYVYLIPAGLAAAGGAIALARRSLPTQAPGAAGGAVAGSGMFSLAGAGLLTLAVANLPQLVLLSREVSETVAGTGFVLTVLLARIVLLALAPVQSVLLPAFTASVASNNLAELRRRHRMFTLAAVGGGLAWTALVTAVGPWALTVMFAARTTSRPLFLLLALGSVAIAVGTPYQIALVALGHYRWVPVSWGVGAALTAALAFAPGMAPITAATVAAVIGPLAVVATMAYAMRRALRSPEPLPDPPDAATPDQRPAPVGSSQP